MKKILSFILVLVIVAGAFTGCDQKPDLKKNGNAYEIHTAADLKKLADNPGENYILMADIDMSGESWTPVKNFSGTLNGNYKTISNLSITTTAKGSANMGLFANVKEGGEIRNLDLENVSIDASTSKAENIGTFAGVCKGKITGCTATGVIADTREGTDGDTINVGAFAGKAEGNAVIKGEPLLSYTDPAGIHTTNELCADVKLFVADSEFVSRGLVADVGENCSVEGLWHDSFYSSERLSDAMRARQQTVVDYMYKMGTVEWTVPSRMIHTASSKIHNQVFLPGQTYYGIPYDHTAGSYERFMSCMDENNQVKQWVAEELGVSEWSGSDPSLLGFTVYMGNDCSSAVAWAWMQVSPNETYKDIEGNYQGGAYVVLTSEMMPNSMNQDEYGIYPVGSWNGEEFSMKDAIYQAAFLTKCSEIVAANGEEKIFEAYACARKADALLFGEPGGHARLISEDPVVIRNADNSIDIEKSYILCHEQGDGLYNNLYEGTNSSWRINYRYTFDVLMHGSKALTGPEKHLEAGSGKGYLPITIRALRQEEIPEAVVLEYPEIGQQSAITPTSGRFYSNFRIQSTIVTVKDSSGEVVYHKEVFTGSDGRYDSLRGENTTVRLEDHHEDALDGLSPGTYTFTVQIQLSDGSIHTMVDNETYNHS